MNQKIVPLCTGVIALSIFLCAAIYAWTEPTALPPNGSVDAPINTGNSAQNIAGELTVKGGLTISSTGGSGSAFALNANDGMNSGTQFVVGQDGHVGIGVIDPGAILQLRAGTAAANHAPLKFSSGPLLAATEAGAIEYDGTHFYFTSNDLIRHQLGQSGGGITAQICPTGKSVVGIDNSGAIICAAGGAGNGSSGGVTQVSASACADPLPAGNKRIFVTRDTVYGLMGGAIGSDPNTNADNTCQSAATAAGLTGSFKAVFAKFTTHPDLVLSSQYYWNGALVTAGSTNCNWNFVASSESDFFTDKGSGSYLQNPISYNEYGTLNVAANQKVWTDIKPSGNGSYAYLNSATYQTLCSNSPCGVGFVDSTSPCMARWCSSGTSCFDYNYWIGDSTAKNLAWAYSASIRGSDSSGLQCRSTLKYALYCVEQ
jgi:hypothetical protein